MSASSVPTDRDRYMDARRQELGLSWEELAEQIGLSRDGLRKIRTGQSNPYPRTVRNLESVLRWRHGSLALIDAGKPPVEEPTDAALRIPTFQAPVSEDYPAALRRIRRAMGPAAFRAEVARIELEDTERDHQRGA